MARAAVETGLFQSGRTKEEKKIIQPMDTVLLALTLMLMGLGIVMVFSSSAFIAERKFDNEYLFFFNQLKFATLGLGVLLAASVFPYRYYKRLAFPILFIVGVFLIGVLIFGKDINGAKRWLDLGFFNFQPSEAAKVALIIYLAHSISKKPKENGSFASDVLNHLIFPGMILFLIAIEPDLGTMMIAGAVSIAMLIAGGSRMKHVVLLISVFVFVGFIFALVFPHVFQRLKAFIDQLLFLGSEIDYAILQYQVKQSLISFGSGQIFGMGLGQGTMKLLFLPEAHNDFILATIGQELGVIGVGALFVLFGLFAYRGYSISLRTNDMFGCILAYGITTLYLAQFLLNVGVVIGLMPPTGISMPLISYGGSSMIMTMFGIGVLLNISREARAKINFRTNKS